MREHVVVFSQQNDKALLRSNHARKFNQFAYRSIPDDIVMTFTSEADRFAPDLIKKIQAIQTADDKIVDRGRVRKRRIMGGSLVVSCLKF